MSASPIRCAIYIRSAVAEHPSLPSPRERQRNACVEFAALRGWQIVGEYADWGFSGMSLDRPELSRLLDDANGRKFDVVLIVDRTRLSRSLADLAEVYEHITNTGACVVAVHEWITK